MSAESQTSRSSQAVRRATGIVVALVVLVLLLLASLAIGSRPVAPADVIAALTGGDVSAGDRSAVVDLRIPRTVAGLLVGAALAVAGALIQALTRNPLADPGILGVNAGSAFFVALGVALLGLSPSSYIWLALAGALLATVAVHQIGSAGRGGGSPARITLTGMAIGAVLAGIVSGLRLLDPQAFVALLSWEAGSIEDRGWDVVGPIAPFVAVGLVLALGITRSLNAVAMGDDIARAQGAVLRRVRGLTVVAVTLLAGGATAIAGPIGFVGLMIPHAARWIVGPDQRWIVGFSMVVGPILVLAADLIARVALWPGELPVGIVTAFVGAPVLIVLARRRGVSEL